MQLARLRSAATLESEKQQSQTELDREQQTSLKAAQYAAEMSLQALDDARLQRDSKLREAEAAQAAALSRLASKLYNQARGGLGSSAQTLDAIAAQSLETVQRMKQRAADQATAREKMNATTPLAPPPAAQLPAELSKNFRDELAALVAATGGMEELVADPSRGYTGSIGSQAVRVATRAKKLAAMLGVEARAANTTQEGADLRAAELSLRAPPAAPPAAAPVVAAAKGEATAKEGAVAAVAATEDPSAAVATAAATEDATASVTAAPTEAAEAAASPDAGDYIKDPAPTDPGGNEALTPSGQPTEMLGVRSQAPGIIEGAKWEEATKALFGHIAPQRRHAFAPHRHSTKTQTKTTAEAAVAADLQVLAEAAAQGDATAQRNLQQARRMLQRRNLKSKPTVAAESPTQVLPPPQIVPAELPELKWAGFGRA